MKRSIQNAEHYQWGANCDGWHLLKSASLSVIQEKMPPLTAEQIHCHRFAQQLFYILSGTATFYVNGVIHTLSKHESIHLPAGVLHNIQNLREKDLEFLVTSEPAAQGDRIEIVDYNEDLKTYIRDLNIEWLEKYFKVEKRMRNNCLIRKGRL
jgi:mannose-6-phosphate isomerase-like protein (cupin superfamily)